MLKFEGILVGTKIKAYDFGIDAYYEDHFVTGRIIHTETRDGAKVYAIICEEDGSATKEHSRVGQIVFVPMETTMDYDGRVTPLDGPCAPKSDLMKEIAGELGLPVIDHKLAK